MKKLLILIVAAAVYLHFYPEPELEAWYNKQKNAMLASFNKATDTKVRLSVKKVQKDLETKYNQFSPEEIKYVKSITTDRDQIVSFYKNNCEKKKVDYNLQTANQAVVCNVVGQYRSYF